MREKSADDLGDHAGGEDHDRDVGAGEEDPGQVLVEHRPAALAGVEEDPVEAAVEEQHGQRGEHDRAGRPAAGRRRRPRRRRRPAPGATPSRAPAWLWSVTKVDRKADEAQDREPDADDPGVDPACSRRRRSDSGGMAASRSRAARRGSCRTGYRPARRASRRRAEAREGDPAGADLERRDVADRPDREREAKKTTAVAP